MKHLSFLFSLLFAALHEFPNDVFTNEDRRHGAVVLHVLCVSSVTLCFFSCQRGQGSVRSPQTVAASCPQGLLLSAVIESEFQ